MNAITALAAVAFSALFAAAAGAAGPPTAAEPPVSAAWQEHKGSVDYFGLTSRYSCSGIEGKVRQILTLLGARKDITANANACDTRDLSIGHSLTVNVHYFTLVEADPASTAPHVMARWSPVQIKPRSPSYLEDGDCDLIDSMHDFIAKNFSSRNLQYRAECTPRQVHMDSFGVTGEFLEPAAP